MRRKGFEMPEGESDIYMSDWRERITSLVNNGRVRQSDVAGRIADIAGRGVEQSTVSRWLTGTTPRQKHLRAAVRHMLEELQAGTWPTLEEPATAQPKPAHAGETWPDYLTEVLVREARAAEKRAEAAASWARWLEKEADGWAGAKPQPALTSSEEAAAKEEEAKREEERRRNQAQPSAG